jgi:hypothetical protein
MFKEVLNLEGVEILSKNQMKVLHGEFRSRDASAEVCTAICADGSSVTVSMCSDAGLGCSTSGGSSSCSCKEGKGPFDPPGLTKSFS